MMGPEIAKDGADFIPPGMSVNGCGELGQTQHSEIRRQIQEVAERVVNPGGTRAGRAQWERQDFVELQGNGHDCEVFLDCTLVPSLLFRY
jgi:hypothetical protein